MVDKWVTFDCYGTLVDWRTGMRTAFAAVAPDRVDDLLDAYHRHENVVQSRSPAPTYRAVLAESLRLAAADLGLPLSEPEAAAFAETLPSWPVFAETGTALRELRARQWGIGVLSNVDDDLFERTRSQLGAPIDVVVTAQSLRSYKPAPAHFEEFARRTGATPQNWVHVAGSWFHDLVPAIAAGIPAVYVDREGDRRDTTGAAAVRSDLTGLVDVVDGLVPAVSTREG
jgi:2-haloacid dehalogenase